MSTYAYHLLKKINFGERRILEVMPLLNIRTFNAGEVIWEKGAPVMSWYCVMSGYVAASVPTDSVGKMPMHILGQHAWFGEQEILSASVSAMEYSCLTPVRVIGMPETQLNEAFGREPDFVRFLVGLVNWRLQQHSEMLMCLRLGNSSMRVVMGLAQLAEALSIDRDFPQAAGDNAETSVEIPVSQELIASLCGVSRTVFSVYLQHLARAGWVKVRYGAIELRSAHAWRAFAQRQRQSQRVVSRPGIDFLLAELSSAAGQIDARQGRREA